MLQIDGAKGEGGGQILRSSLTLSLLTGRAFELRNIRAGRSKPGLQAQHLASVRAAASIGSAQVVGDRMGSDFLRFEPGPVSSGDYHFAVGTAGATSLVLHTVFLPLALKGDGPSKVTISGGTHTDHSPVFEFLETTWAGYMALLGIHVQVSMLAPGFYPRGGGKLLATIEPSSGVTAWSCDEIERPRKAGVRSVVSGLTGKQAESVLARQAKRAVELLRKRRFDVVRGEDRWNGSPGTVLSIILGHSPVATVFSALGRRGKPAEEVAEEAVREVDDYLSAEPLGIDPHSSDQILLPLALADRPSSYPVAKITRHLLTQVETVAYFLEREIEIVGPLGGSGFAHVR